MAITLDYKGISWRVYHRSLLPNTHPHTNIQLSEQEARELMDRSGTHLIRYTSGFDSPTELPFWYVIKDDPASLESLSSNTRSKVRRGLKRVEVNLSSRKQIAEEGYEVYQNAFDRYDTNLTPATPGQFRENIMALDEKEWELWEVRDLEKGTMIAYSRNRVLENTCTYSEIKFHPSYLKHYPSYALFQNMNEYYLNERRFRYVNDGPRSIAHETNIQSFLIEKFGFRRAYCRLHVHYHPRLGAAIKLLFPFRNLLGKRKKGRIGQLITLLDQEAILRSQPPTL